MIDLSRDGGLVTLTLNRPEKANSLTAAMLADLIEAARGAQDARAVIITGAGETVFSAGADLEEARAGLATSPLWEELSGAVASLPCLTIAALNGTLAGGAFGMALACDLRFAVPHATFFYPVAKLGFLPQPSDPARIVALVGPARAKQILLAGARLNADEARAAGLIDAIHPTSELMGAAHAACAHALANPGIVKEIKSMIG